MTSRVSTGTSSRHLLPHIGVSPRAGRQPFAIEPIRSQQLPVGPEYAPEPLAMRMQDIVPEYEKTNPTMVKLDDMHRELYANKRALISAFEEADAKRAGVLRKKDFTCALKTANQRCKLNIPRVLIDGVCDEAAEMFGPEKDPRDPKDRKSVV